MPHIYVRGAGKRLLSSMRIVKSGNQSLSQNTSTVVAPMVPDSSFPGTMLQGTSGVRANIAGEWQVAAQCTWNTPDDGRTFRLLKNGVAVASTTTPNFGATAIQAVSAARVPVVEGDVLTIDARSDAINSGDRVVKGGEGTFLRALAIPEGSPADVGMNKSGSQTVPYNSWTTVTGWVADASKPGSSVSGNGLAMTGTGSVVADVSVSHATTVSSTGVRVRRNGVLVAEFSVSQGSHTSTGGTSIPFAVSTGDALTVEFMTSSLSGESVSGGSLSTTVSM